MSLTKEQTHRIKMAKMKEPQNRNQEDYYWINVEFKQIEIELREELKNRKDDVN